MVSEKLKSIRDEKGYSLSQVQDMTGISRAYISYLENGQRTPSPRTLAKLAKAYNYDARELMKLAGHLDTVDYIMENKELPEELRKIGIEYIKMAKYMEDKQVPPEDIKTLVDALSKMKRG